MQKKSANVGKYFSVVLLHFLFVGVTSDEHSKHICHAFFLFYEENKTFDIASLYVRLCVYVHIASVIIF
jgi:hypothetical protein